MKAEQFAIEYEKKYKSIPIIQYLRVVMNNDKEFHAIRTFDANLALVFDPFNKLIFSEVI